MQYKLVLQDSANKYFESLGGNVNTAVAVSTMGLTNKICVCLGGKCTLQLQ